MKLRFGKLEDIIFIKAEDRRALQKERDALLAEECANVEDCDFRKAGISCDTCSIKEQCREDSAKVFAKVDEIEIEIERITELIMSLCKELFISQNKTIGVHIEHLNLELFPETKPLP